MPRYEYMVVPAPEKGLKGKGIRTPEARFSHALQELMNGLAGAGWEYQRAETLPSVERAGLTSTKTEWRNVLVFRRPRQDDTAAFAPELLPPPEPAPVPKPVLVPPPATSERQQVAEPPHHAARPPGEETRPFWDNGVEDADGTGGVSKPADMVGMASAATRLAATRKSAAPKE